MRGRDLLDLLAPPRCHACARPSDTPLCDVCTAAVRWRHVEEDAETPPDESLTACVTLLWLDATVAGWVHRFKYPVGGVAGLDGPACALAALLARRLGERLAPVAGDRVIPIPLHPRRLRARGFNPAALIAHHAFRGSAARLEAGWLARVRDTPSQAGLGRDARRHNVTGAFACRMRDRPPARVWLVDDVVTTGVTLGAAASALRRAGVREVFGVGLARTPAPGLPAID